MRRAGLAVLLLAVVLAPARGQTDAQKKETVAYLRGLEADGGGFRAAAGQGAPTVSSTTSALRALRYFGGKARNQKASEEFVRRCFDPASGAFAATPRGKPDVISTAVGLLAVADLKMPGATYRDAALKYLGKHAQKFEEVRMTAAALEAVHGRLPTVPDWLADLKRRDKALPATHAAAEARAAADVAMTILRLGGKLDDRDRDLKLLQAGQRADGAWGEPRADGSDLATSYHVVRALHMLKAKPAHPERCRGFVARCRNADGGYGTAPGKPSAAAGTYYASIILHWLDEP
jgi:prenyltransferase beta subunit